jgi:hypothetical protein
MSWYRIAQQQENWKSIVNTGTPGKDTGIVVDANDLRQLQSFISTNSHTPITVTDRSENKNLRISILHGGVDANGKFAFSDGKGNFVYPKNEDDPTFQLNPNDPKFNTPWENRLGIGSGDKIIACHEGVAEAGQFDRVTTYRGKLQVSVPQQIDPNQDLYYIEVTGA